MKTSSSRPAQLAAPVPITEVELLGIEADRRQLADLRRAVASLERTLEARERSVMDRIKAGAVSVGSRLALIVQKTGPVRPEWKNVYLALMESFHGVPREAAEEDVRARTPPVYKDCLIIEERR